MWDRGRGAYVMWWGGRARADAAQRVGRVTPFVVLGVAGMSPRDSVSRQLIMFPAWQNKIESPKKQTPPRVKPSAFPNEITETKCVFFQRLWWSGLSIGSILPKGVKTLRSSRTHSELRLCRHLGRMDTSPARDTDWRRLALGLGNVGPIVAQPCAA